MYIKNESSDPDSTDPCGTPDFIVRLAKEVHLRHHKLLT